MPHTKLHLNSQNNNEVEKQGTLLKTTRLCFQSFTISGFIAKKNDWHRLQAAVSAHKNLHRPSEIR